MHKIFIVAKDWAPPTYPTPQNLSNTLSRAHQMGHCEIRTRIARLFAQWDETLSRLKKKGKVKNSVENVTISVKTTGKGCACKCMAPGEGLRGPPHTGRWLALRRLLSLNVVGCACTLLTFLSNLKIKKNT